MTYPISKKFEFDWHDHPVVLGNHGGARTLFNVALSNIGEYEHGSVDIEDVSPLFKTMSQYDFKGSVQAYADVISDMLATLDALRRATA